MAAGSLAIISSFPAAGWRKRGRRMGPLSFKETSCKSHQVHLLIYHWSELSLVPHVTMREAGKYGLLVGRPCVQVRIITRLIWERSKKYPRRQLSSSAPDMKYIFVYWFIMCFPHEKLAPGKQGLYFVHDCILNAILDLPFLICFHEFRNLGQRECCVEKNEGVHPDLVRNSAVVDHKRLQWLGLPSNH